MKQIIASLVLMLVAFSAFADTVYLQGVPQQCQRQLVYDTQTGVTSSAWVCPQQVYVQPAPPTIIYSSPPTQTIVIEQQATPWYVPFAAGVGTALILRGGGHYHHHR
jgi:hypothetical protein